MENTLIWDKYQKGLDYQSKISFLPTVDKNERFYSGDQWHGIKTNKLPTPVLNVTKRIIDWKVSQVMSDLLKMQFSAEGISDSAKDESSKQFRDTAKLFTEYTLTLWENLKMDSMNEKGLLKAAQACSFVSYWYWYDKVDNGDGQMGNINREIINSCNYFPGDPNDPEINNAYEPVQPYIVLAFRKMVSDVRREASENGVTEEEIKNIVSDDEKNKQAGDMAKTELDGDDGKCIVLLYLYKELINGVWHIWAEKSTKLVRIRPKWDTGLHRYPVALMNWYEREGSAYGEAEGTYLVPNNIMINQQAAMLALWIKLHGFPKVLFDKTRIGQWSNDLTSAIPVNGTDVGGVSGAAAYMQPAQISAAVMDFMQWFIQITKDMAGANESVLGESTPINTSAIIVNSKNAVVPLMSIKRRFYQYIEDVGLIWLDFFTSKYTDYPIRNMEVTRDGKREIIPFDTSILQRMKLKLKIDVGPSNQWNEAAQIQTLDNLLNKDLITFVEYLERQSDSMIPGKDELLESRKSAEAQQRVEEKTLLYQLMAEKMGGMNLSPEVQNQLSMLQRNDAKEYERQAKQIVRQPMGGMQNDRQPQNAAQV
jgi:hypothetical protein